jgi:hypothetical protein
MGDLSNIVFQNLENKGIINEIKAKLQTSIYQVPTSTHITSQHSPLRSSKINRPPSRSKPVSIMRAPSSRSSKKCLKARTSSTRNVTCIGPLLLSLFHDFLVTLKLDYTLEVFRNECNLPKIPPKRDELTSKVGVTMESAGKLPVIIPLLSRVVKDAGEKPKSPSVSAKPAATANSPAVGTAAPIAQPKGMSPISTAPPVSNKMPSSALPAGPKQGSTFGAASNPYDFDIGGSKDAKKPIGNDFFAGLGDDNDDDVKFGVAKPVKSELKAPSKLEEPKNLKGKEETKSSFDKGGKPGILGDLPPLGGGGGLAKPTLPAVSQPKPPAKVVKEGTTYAPVCRDVVVEPPEEIFEEILDEDIAVSGDRKLQESDDFNASQSQGVDHSVQSGEMAKYDYFEDIK